MHIKPLNPDDFRAVVFFTGAGISAESGIPTYRGKGGIWDKYNWEEVACEEAFQRDPEKVLEFHLLRRRDVTRCRPHAGHRLVAELEKRHPDVTVVTQNIDGLHHQAGATRVIELHGSLWRMRCPQEGTICPLEDPDDDPRRCPGCGGWLRPDIVWFGDLLDPRVVEEAERVIAGCDLFIAVGTSGAVWPAAGLPQIARERGATCIEVNPEPSAMSALYHRVCRGPAGAMLPALFPGILPD